MSTCTSSSDIVALCTFSVAVLRLRRSLRTLSHSPAKELSFVLTASKRVSPTVSSFHKLSSMSAVAGFVCHLIISVSESYLIDSTLPCLPTDALPRRSLLVGVGVEHQRLESLRARDEDL